MTRLPTAAAVALNLAVGAAACLSLPCTATGAIVSGGFSGTVAGNTRDTYGLFGAAGNDLSRQTLTATYSYDTSAASFYSAQPTFDDYLGTGGLTLSVTIGGRTVATAGVTDTEIVDAPDGTGTLITLANFAPTPLIQFTLLALGAWLPGVTINAPFILDPNYYQQTIYVTADGSHYDTINFAGSSTLATPAPEPASIGLLGAAAAGIGYMRRRRNRMLGTTARHARLVPASLGRWPTSMQQRSGGAAV